MGSIYLDIDECKENGRICIRGRCENTPGSYRCACLDGFIPAPDGDFCLGKKFILYPILLVLDHIKAV